MNSPADHAGHIRYSKYIKKLVQFELVGLIVAVSVLRGG